MLGSPAYRDCSLHRYAGPPCERRSSAYLGKPDEAKAALEEAIKRRASSQPGTGPALRSFRLLGCTIAHLPLASSLRRLGECEPSACGGENRHGRPMGPIALVRNAFGSTTWGLSETPDSLPEHSLDPRWASVTPSEGRLGPKDLLRKAFRNLPWALSGPSRRCRDRRSAARSASVRERALAQRLVGLTAAPRASPPANTRRIRARTSTARSPVRS